MVTSTHRPSVTRPGEVALGLLRASDAMNDALLADLAARGWPAINRSESLVFAHIDRSGTSQAELARRIGITKQSIQAIVQVMVGHELLELRAHPTDRRASLVLLTPRGQRMATAARHRLIQQERAIETAVGEERFAALCDVLALDWRELINATRTPPKPTPASKR